ncbi:MAG TPA: MarR family transcriptional regulator [Caulobacteraceae bacterium]|nr:MarR family transcriptional regulator [Caulobacteraceae bacterium]
MGKASDLSGAPGEPTDEFPFPVPTYLFHLFTTIARLRDTRLDKALKPLGLNVTRHRAIAVIALLEPCTMSELADFSAIDRTTMTRIVDQLVARGQAQRAIPDADRRQVMITLTDQGQSVYRAALKIIAEANRNALKGVPDDLLRAMTRAEQLILVNLSLNAEHARRLLVFKRE